MGERFELVDRVGFIRESCVDKSVLHLGCTNYPYTDAAIAGNMLLHDDLKLIAADLHGLDFDEKGLEILRDRGFENLYQGDVENLAELNLESDFDVIVAGEIIEHLDNPGKFLSGIQHLMNHKTRLVITTINAYCAMRYVIYGLRGKGGENEPVHPDHVAYYSYKTLKLSIERAGLELERFAFYDISPEHRPGLPWYYKLVNDVAVRIGPQLSDGVIAVCRLKKKV